MTNQQKKRISDITLRRNKTLLQIFKDCDLPVRLLGDEQKPVIIYQEAIKLAAYVHNFDLHLLDKPDGKILVTHKIKQNHKLTHNRLMHVIARSVHEAIYKIRMVPSGLFLVGYNYTDDEPPVRYPVFARHAGKIYFDVDYVDQLCAELNADDYDVTPYIPVIEKTFDLKYILPTS